MALTMKVKASIKVKVNRKYSLLKKLGELEIAAAKMGDVFEMPNQVADAIHEAWSAVLNAHLKEKI